MKSADARKMLEAARTKANQIGKPVTVVIVDAAGALVILERLNDAGAVSAITAEGKAVGSALTGRTSAQLMEAARNGSPMIQLINQRAGGRLMPQQGAVPIIKDGEIVGAIGVGGATSEEDEQIAMAGRDAFV